MRLKLLIATVVAGVTLAVVPAIAQAWDYDQAFQAAWHVGVEFCNEDNSVTEVTGLTCVHANVIAPLLYYTGSNDAHTTQWKTWSTNRVHDLLSGNYDCYEIQTNFTPYGAVVLQRVSGVSPCLYSEARDRATARR